MKSLTQFVKIFVIFALFYLSSPQKVYAYLDPGTGSYFFQLFIGLLLGGLFAIRLYWHKIKDFFKKL